MVLDWEDHHFQSLRRKWKNKWVNKTAFSINSGDILVSPELTVVTGHFMGHWFVLETSQGSVCTKTGSLSWASDANCLLWVCKSNKDRKKYIWSFARAFCSPNCWMKTRLCFTVKHPEHVIYWMQKTVWCRIGCADKRQHLRLRALKTKSLHNHNASML